MVGSKGHVDERRIRPVYDALDNLNNRQAIKLAEAILKKQKECHCAKALKALALVRSGKSEEAFPLLEDVKAKAEKLDDSTLQAMTMCYKESFQPEGVVSIYELAVKQTKNNEEFLSHLFMAYVRVSNYAKQQQAAMNLYKVFPKNPYYFWAVMSNVMQALSATDAKKKGMFLSLAECMVVKFIKEKKIEAEEEDLLYLMILEFEEKYEDLLVLMRDEGTLKSLMEEKEERRVEYLTALKRWPEVNVAYKKLLIENPDQWSFIKGYLDSFQHLKNYVPDAPIDTTDEQPDFQEECVQAFLSELAENNSRLRGPLLGLMELSKYRIEQSSKGADELLRQTQGYFLKHGSKPCCFGDLSPYTDLLDGSQREQFLDCIKSQLKPCPEDAENKEKIKYLWQEICVECFARRLNLNKLLTKEELFGKAKSYIKRYYDSLDLGRELNRTEPQHGDVFVLLAVYILLDLNNEKGDDSLIWHILLVLEEAVEKSPSFAQFKLLLMFLYYKLGVSGVCEKLMEEIEIKYIMYDSLGYFLSAGVYGSGQFQLTQRLYDATHAFYKASRKDIPEQIIASYKYGSFKQVTDITLFRKRVENSWNRAWARVEQLYLNLIKYCNSVNEAKKRFQGMATELESLNVTEDSVKELHDNRDFLLFSNYDEYSSNFTEEEKTSSFQLHLLWLRYRYLTLRLLQTCLSNGNNSIEDNQSCIDEKNSMERIIEELENIISVFEKHNCSDKWETVHRPPPIPLVHIVQWKYNQVLSSLAKCCSTISNSNDADDARCSIVISLTDGAQKILQDNHDVLLSSLTIRQGGGEMFNGKCLQSVVYFVETCTLGAVLLAALKDILKQKGGGKGRKKKPQQPQQQQPPQQQPPSKSEDVLRRVKEFSETISGMLQVLLKCLSEVKVQHVDQTLDDKTIVDLFEKTNSTVVTKIWDKVQSSYQQSVQEINQIIELKIKFYDTLKL